MYLLCVIEHYSPLQLPASCGMLPKCCITGYRLFLFLLSLEVLKVVKQTGLYHGIKCYKEFKGKQV